MTVFSIPAFFIVLREVLEACLVVGIALAYFARTGNQQYVPYVWIGAGAGVLVSLSVGIAFAVVYFVKGNQIFEDKAEKIFEGVAFLIAAALLTWMIIWMMYMGRELRTRMEEQLDDIIDNSEKSPARRKLGVFLMVFVQVLREGIETFIFIFGSANADDNGGWRAIPLPGILAIIVGVVISFLVFKGMVNLDIQSFFFWSSFLLIAFAAGLVSHAFHELQEVDWFGTWKPEAPAERDWYNEVMWTTKRCCHDKENQFFAMLRALFGYQDTPTFVEWITYFAYWVIVIALYVAINWSQIRASKRVTYARTTLISSISLLFSFIGFIYVLINRSWIGLLSMILAFLFSIVTVMIVFDPIMSVMPSIAPKRRTAVNIMAYAWAVLTFLMIVLHFVQLICEGTGEEKCGLDKFYFFSVIFSGDFRDMGRTTVLLGDTEVTYWPAIALLSISLIVTFFFYGGLTFRMFLMAMNINDDGEYMHENYVYAQGSEVGSEDVVEAKEANMLTEMTAV